MKKFLTAIFAFLLVTANAQVDEVVPKAPSPQKLVNDYTNTLTAAQVQALESKLVAYDDSTSNQVVIVIVNSLEGYDPSDYAMAIGKKWGVGNREFNNGIVILAAMEDRKMSIQAGYGLEGAITDLTAKSIIDNSLTPNFREGNYYRGFDRAVDDLIAAAAGKYKAPAGYGSKKTKGPGIGGIIGLIILLIILGALGGGRGGRGGGVMSGAGWIIGSMLAGSGRSGGGGGWSGGGGGGGFGGFGGGSFGGGGASGSW